MKKQLILIQVFILCIVLISYSQNNSDSPAKYKHILGAAAGFTTGYGISYRYWPQKYGVQATFAPYIDQSTTQFSAGLVFLYKLKSFKKSNFFLYQGNHLFYDKYTSFHYLTGLPDIDQWGRQFHGLGFGFEILFLQKLSLNLMGGYMTSRYLEDKTWLVNMTGEIGLYYQF